MGSKPINIRWISTDSQPYWKIKYSIALDNFSPVLRPLLTNKTCINLKILFFILISAESCLWYDAKKTFLFQSNSAATSRILIYLLITYFFYLFQFCYLKLNSFGKTFYSEIKRHSIFINVCLFDSLICYECCQHCLGMEFCSSGPHSKNISSL